MPPGHGWQDDSWLPSAGKLTSQTSSAPVPGQFASLSLTQTFVGGLGGRALRMVIGTARGKQDSVHLAFYLVKNKLAPMKDTSFLLYPVLSHRYSVLEHSVLCQPSPSSQQRAETEAIPILGISPSTSRVIFFGNLTVTRTPRQGNAVSQHGFFLTPDPIPSALPYSILTIQVHHSSLICAHLPRSH